MSGRRREPPGPHELGSLEAIGSSQRRRALAIVNPYATGVSDRRESVVLAALASRYELEAARTREPGHATELASDALEAGYDVVVAFGGDGTVNEVANGLAGSSTPLTALPGGSANVFCKLLGIPSEIVDATEHVLALADRWRPRAIDLGLVAGRHYTFSAGVGLDASVVRRVDARPELKRRFGPNFFLASALWAFTREYLVHPPRLRVTVGGATFTGVTAVVQNAEHYTYFKDHPIDLADDVRLDSGTLAGVVLKRGSPIDAPSLLLRGALSSARITGHRQVSAFAGADAVLVTSEDDRALPLQLDGDYIGAVTEAQFRLVPGALQVLA